MNITIRTSSLPNNASSKLAPHAHGAKQAAVNALLALVVATTIQEMTDCASKCAPQQSVR